MSRAFELFRDGILRSLRVVTYQTHLISIHVSTQPIAIPVNECSYVLYPEAQLHGQQGEAGFGSPQLFKEVPHEESPHYQVNENNIKDEEGKDCLVRSELIAEGCLNVLLQHVPQCLSVEKHFLLFEPLC
ncbi:hypothetical protein FGO68_gene965 [Halteria grandinella]|uniref:Uncharacterized protein n=1 Tax=Halteria grandinella TaxID=5974 RepID=A0A8J8NGU1_HALGN|nr:hypothetical protein FGO68_gene965 [Halteria grandinella]